MTLGGYFVTYVNWQLIFFVNVPIGIVGILLAVILLREVQAETRAPFDVPGFVLAATGLAAVLYALSDASTDGWGSGKVLGLIIQPLSVSAVSDIHPRQFAQSSTLYTVVRFVSTSLGIAVLATLVQTQAKIHYGHLAEQVAPASPLGQVVSRLQSLFVQHGASLNDARAAAIQVVARLVQRQGYMLAIQDAFWFVLCVLIASIIAACFIRMRKYTPPVSQQVEQDAKSEAEKLEAMLPG